MAQASSAAAATAANQMTGGNINVNPPNYGLYAVIGVVVLVIGVVALKFLKKGK